MNALKTFLLGPLTLLKTSKSTPSSSSSVTVLQDSEPQPEQERDPVPEWSAYEEPLEEYRKGGYHPVAIGDVLGSPTSRSRYRVVRKLGWGVYSTVWLVRCESDATQTQCVSAVKVSTGIATRQLHELKTLKLIRERSTSPSQHKLDSEGTHPGSQFVLHLADHFTLHGPNGKHLCLITEPMTESLAAFSGRWRGCMLPHVLIKHVAKQIILALGFLHGECGIVHTDIKPDNILLAAPDQSLFFDALPANDTGTQHESSSCTTTMTAPKGRAVPRVHSHPVAYPLPAGDPDAAETWVGLEVKLADFGVAYHVKGDPRLVSTDIVTTPSMRAPEVCIGAGWGTGVDIWSLGCTIVQLFTGQSLFKPEIMPESLPYVHTGVFGDYPLEMVRRGRYSKRYFEADGTLNMPLPRRTTFKERMWGDSPVPPHCVALLGFLEAIFVIDPEKRAGCKELLEHEWLNT